MVEILKIDNYKLRINKIAGISEIDRGNCSFNIYCGGTITIYRKTIKELEEIRDEIFDVWYKYLEMTESIKEIKIGGNSEKK